MGRSGWRARCLLPPTISLTREPALLYQIVSKLQGIVKMPLRDASTFAAGVVLSLSICSVSANAQQCAPFLEPYNAEIGETSVSGISSGAYMAGQLAVAWSSVIKGVGLIAGGPYFCADGTPGRTPNSGGGSLSADTAQQQCMANKPPGPDLPALFQRTDEFALDRRIDDPANLGRQKIYVFNGYNDPKVLRKITDAVPSYYAHYVPPQATGNLFYQNGICSSPLIDSERLAESESR